MPGERIIDREPLVEEFSFADIHRELWPQLHSFQIEDAAEICYLLGSDQLPLDPGVCGAYAQTALVERGRLLTQQQKRRAAAEVLQNYPDDYLEDRSLPSPKQYCKERGLSGTTRANLKNVQANIISHSKAKLSEDLKAGGLEDCELGITDSDIDDSVEKFLADRDDELRAHITRLKTLLPEQDAEKGAHGFGHLMIRLAGFYKELPRFVVPPKTPEAERQTLASFRELKKALKAYAKVNESSVGQAVSQLFEPQLAETLYNHFRGVYEEIAYDQASELCETIEEAFETAIQNSPTHQKPSPVDSPAKKSSSIKELADQPATTPASELSRQAIEISELGSIDLKLSWCPDSNFNISLMRQNGSALLFFTAMPSKASAISQKLREQQPAADSFDQMWEQARRIELSNIHGTHSYINKVKNVTREGLRDLIILRSGNIQRNAKRLYYAKTTADRYPELAKLASDSGLTGNMPILILVGETDKANQLRLFGDFGISRVAAKAGKAGSV